MVIIVAFATRSYREWLAHPLQPPCRARPEASGRPSRTGPKLSTGFPLLILDDLICLAKYQAENSAFELISA